MMFPVTEHLAKHARYMTCYLACGAAHRPVMMFVPGGPERSISWRHQLPCVASRETVVRDSTGGYWSPLCHILDARSVAVHLGNARHANNLPGRTTAIAACQWRQNLHAFGRLNSSVRPTEEMCV
jgi:hypothetical protein